MDEKWVSEINTQCFPRVSSNLPEACSSAQGWGGQRLFPLGNPWLTFASTVLLLLKKPRGWRVQSI
jgi:hypothetical protein